MGSVALVVHRVVVVVDEVPADQVIAIAVGVLIEAIFPARVVQQVAGIDAPVGVDVRDEAGVAGVVQVTEGDRIIAVTVRQTATERRRNLTLVQPDVQVEVGVGIIHPGVHDTHGDLGAAGGARRPGLGRLAAEGVGKYCFTCQKE